MCHHECRCRCHVPGLTVRHVVACCTECSKCECNIRFGLMDKHLEQCHPKPKNVEEKKE